MDAPLDTPRGARTAVVLGGASGSGAPTPVQQTLLAAGRTGNLRASTAGLDAAADSPRSQAQQPTNGAGFILATRKSGKSSVVPLGEWYERHFVVPRMVNKEAQAADEAASIAAAMAFAARFRPTKRPGGRSLCNAYENVVEQDRERYGVFIERIRRERANALQKSNGKDDGLNPPEGEELETERELETARSSARGTPRNDDAGASSARNVHSSDAVRLLSGRIVSSTPRGSMSERRGAAGLPSGQKQASDGALLRSEETSRRTDGSTSERRRLASSASAVWVTGMTPRESSASLRKTRALAAQLAAGLPSDRRGGAEIPHAGVRQAITPSVGTSTEQQGIPRSQSEAYFTPHIGVDASGRHWDDGSLEDTSKRWAWSDGPNRSLEHRARAVGSAGVWSLSTGAKSRPPAALTEFPCNTWRRTPPRRWYYTQGKGVFVV